MKRNNIRGILLVAMVILLTFTITACDGNKNTDIEVTKISVPAKVELLVEETKQLSPTVDPFNATDKKLTYSTSDSLIATVSETGLITAVSTGEATITVKAVNGVKETVTVNVVQNATGIKYNITETSQIFANEKQDVYDVVLASKQSFENYFILSPNVVVEPSGASQNIEFVSSNSKIAFVQDGKINIAYPKPNAKESTVTITMTAKNKKAKGDVPKEIKKDITLNIIPYNKEILELNFYDVKKQDGTSPSRYNDKNNTLTIYDHNLIIKSKKPVSVSFGDIYKPDISIKMYVDGELKTVDVKYDGGADKIGEIYFMFDIYEYGTTKEVEFVITDNVSGQETTQKIKVECKR